jgi:hypothetical protein
MLFYKSHPLPLDIVETHVLISRNFIFSLQECDVTTGQTIHKNIFKIAHTRRLPRGYEASAPDYWRPERKFYIEIHLPATSQDVSREAKLKDYSTSSQNCSSSSFVHRFIVRAFAPEST